MYRFKYLNVNGLRELIVFVNYIKTEPIYVINLAKH